MLLGFTENMQMYNHQPIKFECPGPGIKTYANAFLLHLGEGGGGCTLLELTDA